MGSISRLSLKCRSCPFVSKCNHKKMESEAYMEPNVSQIAQSPVEKKLCSQCWLSMITETSKSEKIQQ